MKHLKESNEFTQALARQAQEAKLAQAYQTFYNACLKISETEIDLESSTVTEAGASLFGEENTQTIAALAAKLKADTALCASDRYLGQIKDTTYHTAMSNTQDPKKESFLTFLIVLAKIMRGAEGDGLHNIVGRIHQQFSAFFTGRMGKWINTPYEAQRDKTTNKNTVLAITAVQHLLTAWLAFVESYDAFIDAVAEVLGNADLVNGVTNSSSNAKLLAVFARALEIGDTGSFAKLLPILDGFMKGFAAIKADVDKWKASIEAFTSSIKPGTYGDVASKGKNDWEKVSQIATAFKLIENQIKAKMLKRITARAKTQKLVSARAKQLGLSL